jgi:hypothetical protein
MAVGQWGYIRLWVEYTVGQRDSSISVGLRQIGCARGGEAVGEWESERVVG